MNDCRTEDPKFNISPEYERKELTDKYINGRLSAFYQFAKSEEAKELVCSAIDALAKEEDGFDLFWNVMSLDIMTGRQKALKRHLDELVIEKIHEREDRWS